MDTWRPQSTGKLIWMENKSRRIRSPRAGSLTNDVTSKKIYNTWSSTWTIARQLYCRDVVAGEHVLSPWLQVARENFHYWLHFDVKRFSRSRLSHKSLVTNILSHKLLVTIHPSNHLSQITCHKSLGPFQNTWRFTSLTSLPSVPLWLHR